MSKLEGAGVVEKVQGSFYQITDRGRTSLAGDLEAADLEPDETHESV